MTTKNCLEQFDDWYISIYGIQPPDWIKYLAIELCAASFSQIEIQIAVVEAWYGIYVKKIESALRKQGIEVTTEIKDLIGKLWEKSKSEADAIKEIEKLFQPKPKQKLPGSSLG